jgi:hypothetical protein
MGYVKVTLADGRHYDLPHGDVGICWPAVSLTS